MTEVLCHVLSGPEWMLALATGRHSPPRLTEQGFLHCCTPGQLGFVAARHFAGRSGMLVMRFRPELCDGDLEWVRSEPDQEPFPHLRGPIPVDAVLEVALLEALD